MSHDRLDAVRVVQRQHRRLCEGIGRAETGGMLRVALNLDGAAHIAFRQHTLGESPQGHGGGKIERLVRDHADLWSTYIRNDFLLWLAGAGTETRQGE